MTELTQDKIQNFFFRYEVKKFVLLQCPDRRRTESGRPCQDRGIPAR